MKLFTRIKLTYIFMCVVPILVIGILAFVIAERGLSALERQYDIANGRMELLLDPLNSLGEIASQTRSDIRDAIDMHPEVLENRSYLLQTNERLKSQNSYLAVVRENELVFSGASDNGIEAVETAYLTLDTDVGNIFVPTPVPSYITQVRIIFRDGSSGHVCVVTDISRLLDRTQQMLGQWVIVTVLVLILTGMVLIFWLYQSIVKPVSVLKAAVDSIKEGNLDFTIKKESDDEIGQLYDAFEDMRRHLKDQIEISMKYEQDSKELISNISHDLKTPITAIKGYLEGIQDGVADTPEKVDRYVKVAYAKASDMEYLIEELFLYSKLEGNSVPYSFELVNLSAYFEDCVEELSLDLESRGIDLRYSNYADKNVVIAADPEQLKRVIVNIVNNSAKYIGSKRGLIHIRIREESEYVQIEIEDNGKGIAKGELGRIFERTYRTDASRNSAQGGSGLGLSIARKIIEDHGGRIWATSREGVGTNICFVIRKYEDPLMDQKPAEEA